MLSKKLKYQESLNRFPNCPPDFYREIDRNAFRWVFQENLSAGFKPMNLIKEPPQRMLDDSDLMCKGYGLSVFDTLENGLARFKVLYKKKRGLTHKEFIEDKGNAVAELEISGDEGVYGDLNRHNGHFTFHEYEETDLTIKIIHLSEIFNKNEDFK